MMKKLLVLFLLPALAFGQVKESWTDLPASPAQSGKSFLFVFQNTTGTYTDITNPDFTYTTIWDDPEISFPVPFPITHMGVTLDSLYMDGSSDLYGTSAMNDDEVIFSAMSADIIDRGYIGSTSQSPISYVTEGTTPNRIFKMEYKNAGLYEEFGWFNTFNFFTNTQIWIHENGSFEYHFGASNLDQDINDTLYNYFSLASGTAALDAATSQVVNIHCLEGPSNNPIMVDSISQVTEWPTNGTIYKFNMPGIGVNEVPSIEIELYPNPVATELRIMAPEGVDHRVQIMDISGQIVMTGNLNRYNSLDLSSVSPGVYLAKVENTSNGEIRTVRLVVRP